MKPLDPRLLRYARAARAFLVAGGLIGLAQTACVVAFAWFLSQVIVLAIDGGSLEQLSPWILSFAGVVALRAVLFWLAEVVSTSGAARVKSQLRTAVLDAVTRLGPGWVARRNAAGIATVTGPGLDALDTYFSRYLPQLILTAIATPFVVLVIFLQDWPSALSVVLTLPIIPVFMILIGWATRAVQKRQWVLLNRLSSSFLDVVGGLATLTLFGRATRQATRIRSVTEQYRAQTMTVLRVSFLSGFVLELVSSLAVAVVAVSVGIRLIDGSLGLSVALFVLLLAPEAFLPLRQVGAQFHAAADGVAAADDVFDILDNAAAMDSETATAGEHLGSGVGVGAASLVLDSVSAGYEARPVLESLSAEFRPSKITVVTGPSGAGKSTLISVLLGFLPHTGSVELDGRALHRSGVGDDRLAWAGQRPGLLSGTVFENIALGSDAPSWALAERALGLAAASELDLGLQLGVGGAGLSGGQAQRVAIARAIYRVLERGSRVLVLDEPSSALDAQTELSLLDGLRSLASTERLIVIVVSHRAAVIDEADEVLAIEPLVAVV